jgi:hypothetical protein
MTTKHTPELLDVRFVGLAYADYSKGKPFHEIYEYHLHIYRDNEKVSDDMLKANAKLIAAAPELLETLTDLFNDVMYLGFADECNDSFQKARAAIDKATQ